MISSWELYPLGITQIIDLWKLQPLCAERSTASDDSTVGMFVYLPHD